MVRVELTEEAIAQLALVTERVEVTTSDGRVIGWYEPSDATPLPGCPLPAAEIVEARQQDGGRSLSEILDGLHSE